MVEYLHPVSQSTIDYMKNAFGIKVTNPSIESQSLGVRYHIGDKTSNFKKGHAINEKNKAIYDLLKKKSFQTSDSMSIFKDAHTRLYGASPHSTMEQLQNFFNKEQGIMTWFDMETLGGLEDQGVNYFTPTEISFRTHAFKKTGKQFAFDEMGVSNYLISPDKKTEASLRSLINKTRRKITQGDDISLSEAQSRTLADLLKYSEGAKIDTTPAGTIVRAHSANYEQETVNKLINLSGKKTLDKAEQGLNTLIESGSDPKQIAQNLHNNVNRMIKNPDGFIAGHNIKNFDFRAINRFFKKHDLSPVEPDQYIDTYQMHLSMFPSPMSMEKLAGVSPEAIMEADKGSFSLEGLVQKFPGTEEKLGPFRAHVAFNDVKANAVYFENLMSSPDNIDFITTNVMRHGGTGTQDTANYAFNLDRLEPGDELFSVYGMSSAYGPEGSFVTKDIGGEEILSDSYLLPSHRKFQFEGYIQEEGFQGLKLYNPVDEQFHYINAQSKEELAKTVYSKFRPADAFSEKQMHAWDKYVRKDLARSRFRKLTSTVEPYGFENLKRLVQAAGEEKEIIEKGGSLSTFYKERLPEIFSYEKEGKRVALGAYSTYYGDLKERLISEHAFLSNMIDEIEEAFPMEGITTGAGKKSADFWKLQNKRHAALIEAYSEYEKAVGKHTSLEKVHDTRAFKLKIHGPAGKARHIPLDSHERTKKAFNYMMTDIFPSKPYSVSTRKDFLLEATSRIEKQGETLFKSSHNIMEAQKLVQQGKFKEASQKVTHFLEETKGFLPSQINPEETMVSLHKTPEKTPEVIDKISKTLGLDKYDLDSPEALENFKQDIQKARDYIVKEESPGYGVDHLSEILHKHKETIPGMYQPYQEIVRMDERPMAEESVDKYVQKGIEKAKTMGEVTKTEGVGLPIAHDIKKQIAELDENLQTIYDQFGLETRPNDMMYDLESFIGKTRSIIRKKGYELDMRFDISGELEDPSLTVSFFDSKASMYKTTEEIRQEAGAATFEIPLISKDQEMKLGRLKKVSPVAIVEGDNLLDKEGSVKIKSAFTKILEQLEGEEGRRLERILGHVDEGDYIRAESEARRQTVRAMENLVGTGQYGEKVDLTPANRSSDLFRKKSILFNNLFAGTDYAGERLERLTKERGMLFNRIQEELGENITLNIAGTRGKQLNKGIISLLNVQDYLTMGYYNDPGRDSMIQAFGSRTLHEKARQQFADIEAINMNPFFVSDIQAEEMGLTKKAAFSDVAYGPQMKIAVAGEQEMLGKFKEAITTLEEKGHDVSKYKKIFSDAETMPSIIENQLLLADDVAKGYGATIADTKVFGPEEEASLLPHIKEKIAKDGFYELDYGEKYAEGIDAQGKTRDIVNKYKSKHVITGHYKDQGKLMVEMQEQFETREGLTKMMIGQEKFTVRNVLPRELMEEAFGKDVSAVIQPDFAKHDAYGDILGGMFKDTIRQIHSLDVEREIKKQKLEQVAQIAERLTGVRSTVKQRDDQFFIEYSGMDRLSKLFASTEDAQKAVNENALGLDKVVTELENIDANIQLQSNILTMESRFVKNEENVHAKGLGGIFGKHGMRINARQLDLLEHMGYNEHARYLKKSLTHGIDPDLHGQLIDEMGALEHLRYVKEKKELIPDTTKFEVLGYREAIDKWEPLPEGTFVDTGEGTDFIKGKFKDRSVEGTFFGQDEGFYLELPEEVKVDVDTSGTTPPVHTKSIFMARPYDHRDDTDFFTLGQLEQKQKKILEDLREYQLATYERNKWEKISEKKYGRVIEKDIIKERLQEDVQNYYDQVLSDLTDSKGKFMKNIASGRVPGTTGGSIQIMSPYLTQEKDPLKIKDYFGVEAPEDPNIMYVSEDKATDLISDVKDQQEKQRLMKKLKGEGAHGHAVRFPAIHPGSTMPVKYKVSQSLDEDTVRISAELAEALKADSDGDKLYYSLFHDDLSKFSEDINFNQIEEEFQRASERLRGIDTQLTFREDAIENYHEAAKKSYGIDIITNKKDDVIDVIRTQQQDTFVSADTAAKQMDLVVNAKMKNALYTGQINNIVDKVRNIGVDNLLDEGETEHFLSAMGKLTQDPISGKHLSASGEKISDPENVRRALGQKKLKIDLIEDFLSSEEQRVVEKALKEVPTQERQDLIHSLGKSQQVLSKGISPFLESVRTMTGEEGVTQEIYKEHIVDPLQDGLKQGYQEQVASHKVTKSSPALEGVQPKAQQILAKATAPASSVAGVGKLGVAAGVGAGFLGGQMVSAGDSLPMDYMDEPALNPVPDTQQRTINMDVQSPEGMQQIMQEQGPQQVNEISHMLNEENINMVLKGRTTTDRNPEELANLVTESLIESMEYPVNIDIDMHDNRENINNKWIEDQILKAIEG